ncbi:MAG TPA: group II intron reverse transcriptase/maturase [Gemmata sp.]|nr:group II intron reverse transcriptase/maturase [Gemmata sp.]
MEQQRQPKMSFWELREQLAPKINRHDDDGGEVIPAAASVESQPTSANDRDRALTSAGDPSPASLMERVCQPANLNRAYARVKANKGAPGVDGMTVGQLAGWIRRHKQELIASLLDGSYQPQPVRGVQIPKPGGGMRQLGIPTVVDRLVQQAILQVLEPILDPGFSESSYGFRPGLGAHDALSKAREFVAGGREFVVDIDLEKFFDRVNHDVLMNRLVRHVNDKRLLKIIGRFLRTGMMSNGVCVGRAQGTPQGGPLSPLLANLLLDDLDKELERRGHCFCRYADDCNIYVQSLKAGQRVMNGVTRFLERKLRLRVNRDKSAVAAVRERKFLGHRLLPEGHMGIAPQSLARAKERVRRITRRNRGVSLEQTIDELNTFLSGWVAYFRYAECRTDLREMDGWVRRKLRCLRLKQCRFMKPIADWLRKLGVPRRRAWLLAQSGKGWWRLSNSPPATEGMSLAWFESIGLVSLTRRHVQLNG